METQTFRGYMVEATLTADTLTLHGTTKPARMALAGQDHATDPVVPLDAITSTDWHPANPLVNGRLVVHTATHRWIVHFRRKQQPAMEQLAAQLSRRDRW